MAEQHWRFLPRPVRAYHWPVATLLLVGLLTLLLPLPAFAQSSEPRTVTFPSADGHTTLTGYLFAPAGRPKIAPAVILLHGRGGVYLARAKGNYSSVTLARGIRAWANLWAGEGYWALVVDSFGPRGVPTGVVPGKAKPVDELAVRPLDAYGALRYLRQSARVRADRIGLEGWSTGGDVALTVLNRALVPPALIQNRRGFRIAVVMAPHCEALSRLKSPYLPYAPVHIFVGGRGEAGEAAAAACEKAAALGEGRGGDIAATVFSAATPDFDDPVRERASSPANAAAAAAARQQAVNLIVAALGH